MHKNMLLKLAEIFAKKYLIAQVDQITGKVVPIGNDPTRQLINQKGYVITDSTIIKHVQEALRRKGMVINVDGIWNVNSYNALLKYQQLSKIQSDGKLNQRTVQLLGLQ
jgi:hypothetical protein